MAFAFGLRGPRGPGGSARRTHDPATTEELDFAFVGDGCGQADDGRSGLATSRAQPDELAADVRVARATAREGGPEPESGCPEESLDRPVYVVDGQLEHLEPDRPTDRVLLRASGGVVSRGPLRRCRGVLDQDGNAVWA